MTRAELAAASDVALVAAHRAGDRDALGVLLERHRNLVVATAYNVLHDRAAAEDVAQDVAIRVIGSIGRWEERALFTTWLRRLALNLALDHRRRRSHRPPPIDHTDLTDRHEAAPGDAFAAADARADLEALLARLAPRQRQAVRALDLDGIDRRTIARRLGCSAVTVSTQAHKGRRRLEVLAHPHQETYPC